jgi:asparagine synthetase B (glutamine-hydrolysing)
MCGILFTTKKLGEFDMEYVLKFLKNRGPDSTCIKRIQNYSFVHTLLSMTGPPTEQPFYSKDENVICIFNGEIYNFEEFGDYKSDGECLVPLYEKYGVDFINKLDGEFAIILVDFTKNILIFSTDIFGVRPLWMGFDGAEFGLSTYKSCLDRIGITNNYQVLSNKTYTLDLSTNKIINEMRVHTFDLNQHKTSFDDWNKAFAQSIYKRTKYAKCGVFIGMSGGYDSGAIACELTKQNIDFAAYSISNVEDKTVMSEREQLVKNTNLIELERDDFLKARDFLKQNAEEYYLNFDNGEKDKYNELIKQDNYNKNIAETLLKTIEFRKTGQTVTDDNGGIGCSHICSLAKQRGEKIYLSGSGADEIFSDYGFNGVKYFDHSTIGGHFPADLESVFPWKNFFGNSQRAYLMKEEHVAGAYGIEGRYPFLDKYVVQEFLWLTADLKNREYKSPLDNYLTVNKFPYEKNQKTGFNCGFAGPNPSGINFETLSQKDRNARKVRKVTDVAPSKIVNFDQILLKPTNSFENFYNINKQDIIHESGNCYKVKIGINHHGFKYSNKSRFTLLENNSPLPYPVTNHSLIREKGNGRYCIWTSNVLYFSTMDNSDPRTNDKVYAIIKLNDNLRKMKYENFNDTNGKEYYITICIKECTMNSEEYFKIRDIFTHYNFIPNVLVCDNYEIFMDLPNIKFCKFSERSKFESRVTIDDLNTSIDNIRTNLFCPSNYDNNYTIKKGNDPIVTINIFSINNIQFQYALESALSQYNDCVINIIKNELPHDALNAMINRCSTKYAIQMDEDMIFINTECVNKMVKQIQSEPSDTWQYCYSLKDISFGIGLELRILGIKIFNIELMRKHNMKYSNENSFAIDRMIQVKATELGLKNKWTVEQIGYHQKHHQPFDIFLRCAKIGLELNNKVDNWGIYQIGMFLKYITQYYYEELIQTISFIIKKFEKNIDVFFDKLQHIKIPEYFIINGARSLNEYHIDENKFHYIDDLKSKNNIPEIDDTFIPEKTTKFYCLVGFIYPFYFEFEYDVNTYPIEWFNKTFEIQ